MQRLDFLSRRLTHPGERLRLRMDDLAHLARRLCGSARRQVENDAWRVRDLAQRLASAGPDLEALSTANAELAGRLRRAANGCIGAAKASLDAAAANLKHLSPQRVLERGYSITESGVGRIVRDGAALAVGEEVKITFAAGWADAQVRRKG
jgi:exodeoxyribonuclease VII large subunit